MAQAITCDACDDEPAAILVTNVDNGDVLAFGGNCAGEGLAALAATLGAQAPAAELDPSTTRIDTAPAQPDQPASEPAGEPEIDPGSDSPTGPDTGPEITPDTNADSGTDGTNADGGGTGDADTTVTGNPGDPGAPSDQLDDQRALAAASAPY